MSDPFSSANASRGVVVHVPGGGQTASGTAQQVPAREAQVPDTGANAHAADKLSDKATVTDPQDARVNPANAQTQPASMLQRLIAHKDVTVGALFPLLDPHDFSAMQKLNKEFMQFLAQQPLLKTALAKMAEITAEYDALAWGVAAERRELPRAQAIQPLAEAFAALPSQLRTVARFEVIVAAATADIQSEPFRANSCVAWAAAFLALPAQERSLERYESLGKAVASFRNERHRATALAAQARAFAALAEGERTVERYDALTATIDGIQDERASAHARQAQGMAFSVLPEHERTVERYEVLAAAIAGVQGEDGLALALPAWADAFAALPRQERTAQRYDDALCNAIPLIKKEPDRSKALTYLARAFAALAPKDRTVERYDTLTQAAQAAADVDHRAYALPA